MLGGGEGWSPPASGRDKQLDNMDLSSRVYSNGNGKQPQAQASSNRQHKAKTRRCSPTQHACPGNGANPNPMWPQRPGAFPRLTLRKRMKASNCSSKGAPSAGRGSRWYLPDTGTALVRRPGPWWGFCPHHGGGHVASEGIKSPACKSKAADRMGGGGGGGRAAPVGRQEEDGSAIDLLRHLDVLLALHPHGVGLVPQALDVIVDVVDVLAQLREVVDLVEMRTPHQNPWGAHHLQQPFRSSSSRWRGACTRPIMAGVMTPSRPTSPLCGRPAPGFPPAVPAAGAGGSHEGSPCPGGCRTQSPPPTAGRPRVPHGHRRRRTPAKRGRGCPKVLLPSSNPISTLPPTL